MDFCYGTGGNTIYIRCKDTEEVYGFNNYGVLTETNGMIQYAKFWEDIDVVSIIPTGSRSCEMFYNGKICRIGIPKQKIQKFFIDKGNYLLTVFHIQHQDDLGKVPQSIFIYRKGEMSFEKVDKAIEGCKTGCWSDII